jgi:Tfp pilus assembly protein PilV
MKLHLLLQQMEMHLSKNIKLFMKFSKKGQTLIEAVVALAAIMLVLSAISVAITTSVSNSNFQRNQTIATKHAQEGMEYIRFLRNTESQSIFEARTGIQCMNEISEASVFNPSTPCPTVNIDGNYIREATFEHTATTDCPTGSKVTVSVFWASGKCSQGDAFCHRSELVSCFSDRSGTGNIL